MRGLDLAWRWADRSSADTFLPAQATDMSGLAARGSSAVGLKWPAVMGMDTGGMADSTADTLAEMIVDAASIVATPPAAKENCCLACICLLSLYPAPPPTRGGASFCSIYKKMLQMTPCKNLFCVPQLSAVTCVQHIRRAGNSAG